MASTRPHVRRMAVCLALAVSWGVPGVAGAVPAEPTPAQAQKKLEQLDQQVEKLVDRFNKVNGELKIARRKLDSAKKAAKRETAAYDDAREGVVKMAADAYKTGDVSDVSALLSSGDPQSVLDQVSIFSHVSQSRGDKIKEFLHAAQRVEREKGHAQEAFDKVDDKAKDLRKQKAVIEKAITKQRALVDRLSPSTPSPTVPQGGEYKGPATGSAKKALDYAYAQLGKPYVYGGSGPSGFDCSGLTMRAWGAAGVSLPHNAASQYSLTSGKRVSYANLQPGDLIFFSGLGHVGMYVGNGQMIHAPRTGKNVEVVSITSGYYRDRFVGGGRP